MTLRRPWPRHSKAWRLPGPRTTNSGWRASRCLRRREQSQRRSGNCRGWRIALSARAQRSGDLAGLVAPVFMLMDAADHGQEITGPIPTPEELLALTRELGDVRGEGWALSRLSASRSDAMVVRLRCVGQSKDSSWDSERECGTRLALRSSISSESPQQVATTPRSRGCTGP